MAEEQEEKKEEVIEESSEEEVEEQSAEEQNAEAEAVEAEEERKEEVHEVEEDIKEEAEEAEIAEQEAEAEISEEKKKDKSAKPKKEAEQKSDEDEFEAMMRQEEAEKKAEAEAKGKIELMPEPEEEVEEISLIEKKSSKKKKKKEEEFKEVAEESKEPRIYALRTTANREDQVMSFVGSNAARKKLEVYAVLRPHGMRGYIFIEAGSRSDAEQAAFGVPYARGLLPSIIQYPEIDQMIEQVKKEANIQKNDIAEIISGPFKREKCKITRIDKVKEEVVVELLEAAVPIPLTLKMDAVRVIRREGEEDKKE
ncbi:transcription elongation factor Spt5 [Candidatus Woesearchaeota archaeon]|nr:transcription elongation factor Spt5 [Candidatus Woesearchaeota archaeon]